MTREQLERAMEILELKEYAIRRRNSKLDSAYKTHGGSLFPHLRDKWLHDAEISQMAIDRIDKYLTNYIRQII